MITRRSFLKKAAASSLLIGAGSFPIHAMSDAELVHLTILHTNDVHSRIEAFPEGKRAGLGGAAKRAKLIQQIRAEQEHVLLLDAGDIFQGTPYFNYFGGELEFQLMSKMGYDAATIGNHDFDAGIDGLHKQLPHAKFPFIISNYDWKDNLMNGKTKNHTVFEKGGIRIGVLGVGIELDGLVPQKLIGDTQYLDPIQCANKEAAILKNDLKCDYVICLSHLGFSYESEKVDDIQLAKNTRNIDLIIGGHTHTFMERPDVQYNADNEKVLINQVGWAGIMLGRLDIVFEKSKRKKCTACENLPIQ